MGSILHFLHTIFMKMPSMKESFIEQFHAERQHNKVVRSTAEIQNDTLSLHFPACRCALFSAVKYRHTFAAHGQTRPLDLQLHFSTTLLEEKQQLIDVTQREVG
jgi:hypothetical protein